MPEKAPEIGDDVMDALAHRSVQKLIKAARTLREPLSINKIREHCPGIIDHLPDQRIRDGLRYLLEGESTPLVDQYSMLVEEQIKREEYNSLRKRIVQHELEVEPQVMRAYGDPILSWFASVSLLPRLRETRVLNGFARVYQENKMTDEQKQSLLWGTMPERIEERWLPAITVSGEGIFFELQSELVRRWEAQESVKSRVSLMDENYGRFCTARHIKARNITPRLVLIHTLAHILINRLVFECGYSSASLRERLYVSDEYKNDMCGMLIYTAAGDADGTLGGLVRLGRPGIIEKVLQRSLDLATWCSSDPICMELSHHGQGPDSCNLAACHNCALLPETACELFNRFLDRGLVVGDPTARGIGFFEECVS